MGLFRLRGWLKQSESYVVYAMQRVVFHDVDDSEVFSVFIIQTERSGRCAELIKATYGTSFQPSSLFIGQIEMKSVSYPHHGISGNVRLINIQ